MYLAASNLGETRRGCLFIAHEPERDNKPRRVSCLQAQAPFSFAGSRKTKSQPGRLIVSISNFAAGAGKASSVRSVIFVATNPGNPGKLRGAASAAAPKRICRARG